MGGDVRASRQVRPTSQGRSLSGGGEAPWPVSETVNAFGRRGAQSAPIRRFEHSRFRPGCESLRLGARVLAGSEVKLLVARDC